MKSILKTIMIFIIMIMCNLIFQYTSLYNEKISFMGDLSIPSERKIYTFNDWESIQYGSNFSLKKMKWENHNVDLIANSSTGKLSYPLSLDGYFALYVTLSGDSAPLTFKYGSISKTLNLSNEYFSRNLRDNMLSKNFVCILELSSGRSIDIEFSEDVSKIASLSFIPLSDKEYQLYSSESSRDKYFIFDNDMYSDFFQGENSSYDNFILNTVTQYEYLDVSSLNYCTSTTFSPFYKSKIAGEPYSTFDKYKHLVRNGDIRAYEDFSSLLNNYASPIDIVNQKKENFSLFLSYRMNSFFPDDYRGFLNGSLYESFKDKRQLFNYKISFYYSEYREYLYNLISEGVQEFSPKGITLDFTRTPNFFGYELLNKDERKQILSNFVRNIHNSLPSQTKLMVRFPHNYKKHDLDIPSWVQNGYVDYISPSSLKYEEFFPIDDFISMINNTNVKLIPSITANIAGEDLTEKSEKKFENKGLNGINNEYLKVRDYLLRGRYLYQKGAHGVLLFNTNTQIGDSYKLPNKLRYLRSADALNKWYLFEYKILFRHELKTY